MPGSLAYNAVVFAGGGSRCFWQAGFWQALEPRLSASPKAVAAASGGASTACHVLAGRARACMEFYRQASNGRRRNFDYTNLFNGGKVYAGHRVYRGALETVLEDEGMARLHKGPEIRVLMARPPAWAPGGLGTALGYLSYTLEKRLSNPVHPQWGLRLGFRPLVGRADLCRNSKEVADLVLASSCLPPLVTVPGWQGHPVLDGGFIDNAPLALLAPEEGPTLVLLTRRYPREKLQGRDGVTYVQPSRTLAISKFEYVDYDLIQAAFDQGIEDGELFIKEGHEALQR
jgi:predicted acylesterase/phospholipase RssA